LKLVNYSNQYFDVIIARYDSYSGRIINDLSDIFKNIDMNYVQVSEGIKVSQIAE
jgi:hypothetical protein